METGRILRSRPILDLGVHFNEDSALSLLARPTLNYEQTEY